MREGCAGQLPEIYDGKIPFPRRAVLPRRGVWEKSSVYMKLWKKYKKGESMMMEQELNKVLGERFGKTLEEACMEEIYHALLTIVKGRMKDLTPNTGSRNSTIFQRNF